MSAPVTLIKIFSALNILDNYVRVVIHKKVTGHIEICGLLQSARFWVENIRLELEINNSENLMGLQAANGQKSLYIQIGYVHMNALARTHVVDLRIEIWLYTLVKRANYSGSGES